MDVARNDWAEELHNRALRYADAGELDDALTSFEAAEQADPSGSIRPFNVGNLLRKLGRTEEALAAYDRSLALAPNLTIAHHNRAIALLQLGRWAEGFQEYEWRRICPTFEDDRYKLDRHWLGEDLARKTLYVYPELFQGDLIQFSRYALLAEHHGAKVVLAAPAGMRALLRTLSPTIELIADDAPPPDFDYQTALFSLPRIFGTTTKHVPQAPAGYLRPDPGRVMKWRSRIGQAGLKIGIVWNGSQRAVDRSFPLRLAAEQLAAVPGVRLISLQKHAGLDQLAEAPIVEVLGKDFDRGPDAFLDTAAAMECCDLIVSADTSAAHLAGAIGARTWLATPRPADWRWLEEGERTAWYPSMRLFRQTTIGDWGDVFSAMAAQLPSLAAFRRPEAALKSG